MQSNSLLTIAELNAAINEHNWRVRTGALSSGLVLAIGMVVTFLNRSQLDAGCRRILGWSNAALTIVAGPAVLAFLTTIAGAYWVHDRLSRDRRCRCPFCEVPFAADISTVLATKACPDCHRTVVIDDGSSSEVQG